MVLPLLRALATLLISTHEPPSTFLKGLDNRGFELSNLIPLRGSYKGCPKMEIPFLSWGCGIESQLKNVDNDPLCIS